MTDGNEPKIRPTNELPPAEHPAVSSPELEKTESNPESQGERVRVETAPTPSSRPTETSLLRRKPKPTAVPQVRDELTVKIEKILEDGVGDAYSRLSPVKKQEFKLKGEAVARTISEMVRTAHFKVKKILRLIMEWLKMLPGVNRFFLEQEAKIKTDRIIALTKDKL